MSIPANCDKYPFKKSQYIAYDKHGFAFRVRKSGTQRNSWEASPSHMGAASDYRRFTAPSLSEICAKIGASIREEPRQ